MSVCRTQRFDVSVAHYTTQYILGEIVLCFQIYRLFKNCRKQEERETDEFSIKCLMLFLTFVCSVCQNDLRFSFKCKAVLSSPVVKKQ